MSTKQCLICKLDKSLDDFPKNKSHKDGKGSYCKPCNSSKMKRYYQEHPEIKSKQINRATRNRNSLLESINSIKSNKLCCVCSEACPACLDFHHLNSDEKEDSVSTLALNKSIKRIKIEILKCTIICSNCHRKYHAGLIEIDRPTTWMDSDFDNLKWSPSQRPNNMPS